MLICILTYVVFVQTKIRHLEEEVRTQQMLEKQVEDNAKEIEDLREEVEARKQHEQGLRRQLEVGTYAFQIVSM